LGINPFNYEIISLKSKVDCIWRKHMRLFYFIAVFALGILALRGVRWAYIAFILLGLLYFPMSVGFQLNRRPCELTFGLSLAIHSLKNFPHIVMFAIFFVMSIAQFSKPGRAAFLWAGVAVIIMGALVEIGQGVSGKGHCRSRDLIPDAIGALLGASVVLLWRRIRMRLSPV
jgi:hypothetical protein